MELESGQEGDLTRCRAAGNTGRQETVGDRQEIVGVRWHEYTCARNLGSASVCLSHDWTRYREVGSGGVMPGSMEFNLGCE